MKFPALRLLAAFGLMSSVGGAAADALLPVNNQSALARSFALPELGAAEVMAPDKDEYRFAVDWTNEFAVDSSPTEAITLDGETQRYAWSWRHGLAHGFEVGLQLPFFVTNGGVLDGIIHNYHELYGFPDGGRGDAPHHRLLYSYARNGSTILNETHSATEFGDVEVQGGWQALPALALRAMVKAPSGQAKHLTGGNPGGALWADFDPFAGSKRWLGFISAGVSLNGRGDVLHDQQNRWVGFAGTGVGFRIVQPFALSAQVYYHSRLYDDSGLTPLRRHALQGAFGGRLDVNQRVSLNGGFQEDLITDSSPDFSIHFSVVARQ